MELYRTGVDSVLVVGALEAAPQLTLAVKAIPGVKFDEPGEDPSRLTIPATAWMLKLVRDVFVLAGVEDHEEQWASTAQAPAFMHAYQAEALRFLDEHNGGLLAFSMGLGKSVTVAEYARHLRLTLDKPGPTIVLAPKYLRGVWRHELAKFGHLDKPEDLCILDGRVMKDAKCWVEDARFYYLHYDIVDIWWSRLAILRPMLVIIDEAHLIKNGRTRRAKYAKLVSAAVPRRVLLTGTPVQNRPGEIWNLLDTLCGSWTWGGPGEFRVRYSGAYRDAWGLRDTEPTHIEELQQRLKHYAIFKRAEDVIDQLPPLQRTAVEVPFEGTEARDYAVLLQSADPTAILDALLEGRAGQDTLVLMDKLRKLTSAAKVDATCAEAVSALEQGSSVVIFTWQRTTADAIGRKISKQLLGELRKVENTEDHYEAYIIEGSMSQDERDRLVRKFQNSSTPGFLVATYGSLGVGANLEKASLVLLHDLDWVPGVVLQAEARVYRPASEVTRKRLTLSKWMLAEHSLDTFLARTLVRKSKVVDALLGGADAEKFAVLDGVAAETEEDPSDMLRSITDYWQRHGGA